MTVRYACPTCGADMPSASMLCSGSFLDRDHPPNVQPVEVAHAAQNHEIETASGRYLDLTSPDPSAIRLEDIAHALANTCRFGGHCSTFYSVAEHAINVSEKVLAAGHPRSVALAALHHDDAEAYLGDIPRPLKPLLGEPYRQMTAAVDQAIAVALGHLWSPDDFDREIIHAADEWMLAVEADRLLPSRGRGWQIDRYWGIPRFGYRLGMDPQNAEREFLDLHRSFADSVAATARKQQREEGR